MVGALRNGLRHSLGWCRRKANDCLAALHERLSSNEDQITAQNQPTFIQLVLEVPLSLQSVLATGQWKDFTFLLQRCAAFNFGLSSTDPVVCYIISPFST